MVRMWHCCYFVEKWGGKQVIILTFQMIEIIIIISGNNSFSKKNKKYLKKLTSNMDVCA